MAGQALIDFAHQQWFAICAHGVIARHGGYAVFEAGAWRWRSAPFVNAWRVIVDGERWWVDTPSILWEHANGAWIPHHELALDAALDAVPRAGLPRTSSRREPRVRELLACPATPPPTVFTEVVATDSDVWRLSDGTWRSVASAAQLPRPGYAIRAAASDGKGGTWIVDNAGALFYHDTAGLAPVRQGSIMTWQRHTYPDPEPDDFSNPVGAAAVSAAGTVATYRFYNHGRESSYGELVVTARDGTVREQRRFAGWAAAPLFGFVGEQLAVSTWDKLDTLVPPEPSIVDVAEHSLRFTVAGEEHGAPIFVPGPPLQRPVEAVVVNREHWRIDDGALVIESDSSRFAPDLGARIVALFPRARQGPITLDAPNDRAPLVVDVYGGIHAFDGARFESIALDPAIECLFVARRAGTVFVANTRCMMWMTEPEHPPPAPLVFLDTIRARFAGGVAPVSFAVSAKPREQILPQLAGWRRVGRTHAGIALARLLAGTEDAPGPEDHVEVAAGVMAGYSHATDFYLRDGGWAAIGDARSLVVRAS